MAVCSSKECKKYKECAKSSYNSEGINTARDYAKARRYENGIPKEYLCGEMGNYKSFKKA